MHVRHIIWDWNGTLLDDTRAGLQAVNAMLEHRGLPALDLTTYWEIFGFPVRTFYRSAGFKLEEEDWDALAREFHDYFQADTTLRLHAHAVEVLEHIRRLGIGQSVLSASEQTLLRTMLHDFGVTRFFEGVFGVDNLYGHSKLELGRELLARLALHPSAVLLVGDSLHDHEVAADLGVACVLISQGHQSAARLARSGAPILHSLAELPVWLED